MISFGPEPMDVLRWLTVIALCIIGWIVFVYGLAIGLAWVLREAVRLIRWSRTRRVPPRPDGEETPTTRDRQA